ncbi:MAG: class I SAM-dependent methyltransferase [Deltaproteobacteria bacterium]|nr:MAG: class I SAM-dependent methyltransferase [Deltaproteobacteria bacterium]
MDPHRDLKDVMKSFYDRNVRYHELIGGMEEGGYTYDDLIAGLLGRAAIPGRRLRVVDVAAGTGYNLGVAKAAGAVSLGIDLSIHACRIARGKDRDLAVCRGDAEALPFRDAAFDLALCLQLIEHTPFPEKVIGEITRVLRPGGFLFLSAPNMLGSSLFSRILRVFPGFFSREIKRIRPLPADILTKWDGASNAMEVADFDACNRVTVFQALNLLRANGFDVLHLDTLRHPKKYRPGRYALARALQRVPVLRYTGVNFKIVARKR